MIDGARTTVDSLGLREQPQRYRWVMLGLVWLVYVFFGITAGSLAPLVKPIQSDLEISSTAMGFILGAWQLTYVFSAYAMGTLIDRLGVRRSVGLGIAVVTLSLFLRGAAVDFYTLFFVVVLHGIGGPIISIGAPKMVAVWFVGRDRGLGTGIYNTGPLIGAVVVLAATNSVVVPLTGHWRLSFLVYGVLSIVATFVWWLLARDAPEDGSSQSGSAYQAGTAAPSSPIETFRTLFRVRNVRIILLLAFASFFLNHGLTQWLPTVFTDQGMTDTRAGFLAAIPNLVGILGLLFIPFILSHGLRARGLVLLMLVGAVANIGLFTLDGPALITILIVSGVTTHTVMPVLTLVLIETPEVGQRHIGAAAGMFFTAAEVGGFTGPLFLGLLRDVTDTLTSGLVLLTVVAGAASLAAFFISESKQGR